jgi:Xaa-Pro aminopeptidase
MNSKLSKLRHVIKKYNAHGLLIQSKTMKYYLQLPTGSGCNYYLTPNKLFMLYDSRYKNEALEFNNELTLMEIKRGITSLIDQICELATSKFILLENDVTYNFTKKLKKVGVSFKIIGNEFINIRMLKTKKELEILSYTVDLTDKILAEVIKEIKIGMTEQDLLAILVYKAYQFGAEDLSFKPIIAFGERTSMPHGRATNKKLIKTDPIMIDFGIKYKGFESDLTRTFFWEKPSKKMEEIYNHVLKAQIKGIKSIKPGVKGKDIDAIVRKEISHSGYGEHFVHGLGHGVGIDNSTDGPILNEDSETEIQNNMVMTIEPGIYLKDFGGVRIEDVVACINGQAKILSKFSKEIIILKNLKEDEGKLI